MQIFEIYQFSEKSNIFENLVRILGYYKIKVSLVKITSRAYVGVGLGGRGGNGGS